MLGRIITYGFVVTTSLWTLSQASSCHAAVPAEGGVSFIQPKEQGERAFWLHLNGSTSDSSAPHTETLTAQMLLSAHELYCSARYVEAETIYRQILKSDQDIDTQSVAIQGIMLSLLRQNPPSPVAVRSLISRLAEPSYLQSPETWNLALRLVLRQVYSAPAPEKEANWRKGVDLLRLKADMQPLYPETLSDIDRFLALQLDQRGIEPQGALADLMLLAPDYPALTALSTRRYKFLRDAAGSHGALKASWLTVVLALGAPNAMSGALTTYIQEMKQNGDSANLGDAAPNQSAQMSQQSNSEEDALLRAARERLDEEGVKNSKSHSTILIHLFAGRLHEAKSDAEQAAAVSPTDLSRHLDDLAVASALANGKLTASEEALLAYIRTRATDAPRPLQRQKVTDTDRVGGLKVPAQNPGKTSSANRFDEGLEVSPVGAWADRYAIWAEQLQDVGSDDLAARWWAFALNLTHIDRGATERRLLGRLVDDLNQLYDPKRAESMLVALNAAVADPISKARVQFILSTTLYQEGRMADAVAALDRSQPELIPFWSDAELAAAELIRAVALIKVDRFSDANEVLKKLTQIGGTNEQLAQATFLQGWLQLREGETAPALTSFEHLTDSYPGTPYADQARDIIQRLQLAEWARDGDSTDGSVHLEK